MFYIISQFKPSSLIEGVLIVFLGAAVYFAVLFLLRGLKMDDLRYMRMILIGS